MSHGPAYAGALLRGAITRLENALRFNRAIPEALSYYFAMEREAPETRDTQPTADDWVTWLDNTLRHTKKLVLRARTQLIREVK